MGEENGSEEEGTGEREQKGKTGLLRVCGHGVTRQAGEERGFLAFWNKLPQTEWLDHHKFTLLQLWRFLEVNNQGVGWPVLYLSLPLSNFWWLLAVCAPSRGVDASFQSLLPLSHSVLCVSKCPCCHKDTSHQTRANPNPLLLSLT